MGDSQVRSGLRRTCVQACAVLVGLSWGLWHNADTCVHPWEQGFNWSGEWLGCRGFFLKLLWWCWGAAGLENHGSRFEFVRGSLLLNWRLGIHPLLLSVSEPPGLDLFCLFTAQKYFSSWPRSASENWRLWPGLHRHHTKEHRLGQRKWEE